MLFTDIEGSTYLLKQLGERYGDLLEEHRRILREAFAAHAGREMDTPGDAFFIAFARARNAVEAAIEAQQALAAHEWPDGAACPVRMGLHTGEPSVCTEGYHGIGAPRCPMRRRARRADPPPEATAEVVQRPSSGEPRDPGVQQLKDIDRRAHLPARRRRAAVGVPAAGTGWPQRRRWSPVLGERPRQWWLRRCRCGHPRTRGGSSSPPTPRCR
jgi:hypothetical protein